MMFCLQRKEEKRLYCLTAAILTCTFLAIALNPANMGILSIREWRNRKATEKPVAESRTEEKFYIYSWNEELKDKLAYVTEQYPETADRIEFVDLYDSATYQDTIDELLENPEAEKYPDMIALEPNYIRKYTDSDYLIPVEECGVTKEDMSEMYPYTLQVGTDSRNDSVKGVSWMVCPGAFAYRTDLADSLLDVESPEEMQDEIGSWADFLATANKINRKSGGKTKMLASNGEIANAFYANKVKPWVTSDDVFQIDPAMEEYMDVYKALETKDLTQKAEQWSLEWMEGFSDDEVFGYFGCTWFLEWVIKLGCDGERVGEGTYGLWNICQGPAPYYWGGTWIAATEGCSDKDLAGVIMKTLCCETETMLEMREDTLDFVNNKAVMQALSDSGKGDDDFLGGQDSIEIFSDVAKQIDVSCMTEYDEEINELFDQQVMIYTYENKKKKDVISGFESMVADRFPSLKVEH